MREMAVNKKTQALLKKSAQLPQSSATWQCAVRKAHSWVEERDGALRRPYLILAAEAEHLWVVVSAVERTRPGGDAVLKALLNGMLRGAGARIATSTSIGPAPARPERVVIDDAQLAEALRPHLAELNVAIDVADELPELEGIFQEMAAFMEERTVPAVTVIEGASEAMLLEFYEAADLFYRAAPWEHLLNEDIIEVRLSGQPAWYCSVMGGGGQEFGLAFYPSVDDVNEVLSGKHPTQVRQTAPWVSATFNDAPMLAFDDLDFLEQRQIAVADEFAYPTLLSVIFPETLEPGTLPRLQMAAAALRLMPQFAIAHMLAADEEEPQPASATFALPEVYGGHTLTLSFPVAGILVSEFDETRGAWDEQDWDEEDEGSASPVEMALGAMAEQMLIIAEENEPGSGTLMQAINSVEPPIRFAIPKDVVKLIKPKPRGLKADVLYEPLGAIYGGVEGGIMIMLLVSQHAEPVVCSLTQLRAESTHPLSGAIVEYQQRRLSSLPPATS